MSAHPNTAKEQRARVLARLRKAPLTTLEAREELDVLHPAARVMELRKEGYHIETVTAEDTTACGRVHRVARYVLTPTGDGQSLPLPFPMGHGSRRRASA